MKHKTALLKGT